MVQRPAEEGQPLTAGARPKVIYIMGAGRSGSTILGAALGNCEGVFFAGELDRWLPREGAPRRPGEQLEQLWAEVRRRTEVPAGLLGAGTPALERSSALLDPRKWPRRRRLRARYRSASESLYRAIEASTGATHIVDSSHYPLRARELQSLSGIDLHILYLVRDPRSVVASLGRRDVPERRFGTLSANGYLWLTALLSAFVFLRQPSSRRLFVRHEQFVAQPELVLAAILRRFGSGAEPPDLDLIRTGLPFHGNRLIDAEVVRLERAAPSPPQSTASRLTALVQLPWRALAPLLLRPGVPG